MMPPPAPFPDNFEVDEHGNIDWHACWKKELSQLLEVTEEQEKAGADQEWYKLMLWRLKTAFMPAPMQPGEQVIHGPPPPMHNQEQPR